MIEGRIPIKSFIYFIHPEQHYRGTGKVRAVNGDKISILHRENGQKIVTTIDRKDTYDSSWERDNVWYSSGVLQDIKSPQYQKDYERVDNYADLIHFLYNHLPQDEDLRHTASCMIYRVMDWDTDTWDNWYDEEEGETQPS